MSKEYKNTVIITSNFSDLYTEILEQNKDRKVLYGSRTTIPINVNNQLEEFTIPLEVTTEDAKKVTVGISIIIASSGIFKRVTGQPVYYLSNEIEVSVLGGKKLPTALKSIKYGFHYLPPSMEVVDETILGTSASVEVVLELAGTSLTLDLVSHKL